MSPEDGEYLHDGTTRRQFLGRVGAGSALLAVGGGSLLASPAQAAVVFQNGGTISGWDFILNDAPNNGTRSYAVNQQSTGPTRTGTTALRFETRAGETDGGGLYHSEVIKDGVGQRGVTQWFGWSTYIPDDWDYDNKPVIVQQFIQNRGTTSQSNFSPLAVMTVDEKAGSPGQGEWKYRVYARGESLSLGPVIKGQWTDWVIKVYWSAASGGGLKIYKYSDGTTPKLSFDGSNCPNDNIPIDFRLGCYCSSWSDIGLPTGTQDRVRALRHDAVKIGDASSSYTEVHP